MIRKSFFLLIVLSLLAGCASTNLPPVTSREYQKLPDENRIWAESQQEEQQLADSGVIFKLIPPQIQPNLFEG